MKLFFLLMTAWPLSAQIVVLPWRSSMAAPQTSAGTGTPVYLRYGSPAGFTVTGVSNSTPVVITTQSPHSLSPGDTVGIWGTCVAGGASLPHADGIRLVKEVLSAVTFSITDQQGADIVGNGAWCDGSFAGNPGGAQWGGKLMPFSLTDHPRGWLDGSQGAVTRSVALGTNNGLVSLVVAGSVATVTMSFTGYVATGDRVGVWGSGNANLNNGGNPYTVTADSSTRFHFATSGVPDGTYSGANMSCGASGTEDCLRISARAWAGNPPWDKLLYVYNTYAANPGLYMGIYDGGSRASNAPPNGANNLPTSMNACAVKFFVDRADTNARDCGLYWITHFERSNGVNFAANEALMHGGNPEWGDFSGYTFHAEALLFTLLRDYLNPTDKQTFLDKVYNDLADGCAKVTPNTKSGATATFNRVSYDGTHNATTGTIAGSGTLWVADPDPNQRVSVGDALELGAWLTTEYYVTAVNGDGSLNVMAVGNVAGSSPGQAVFLVHAWKHGDCGGYWLKKHWGGESGSQPLYYPQNGSSYGLQDGSPAIGGNNGYTHFMGLMAMDLAAADDDPRAALDLTKQQSYWLDYMLRYLMNYETGFSYSGSYYSYGRTTSDGPEGARQLQQGVPGFPSMDTTGPWVTRHAIHKIYAVLPDLYLQALWPERWGTQTGDNRVAKAAGSLTDRFIPDKTLALAPASNDAQYFKDFITKTGYWTPSAMLTTNTAWLFLLADPRIGTKDYTSLPTQYLFRDTSAATCRTVTGWACPDNFSGHAMISRTGWTNPNDTHLLFEARTFWADHDLPEGGSVRLYKQGALLSSDQLPPGAGGESDDPTRLDVVPEIGGARNLLAGAGSNAPVVAQISRWAGANPTGDSLSRYAYAMADLTGMYVPTVNATRVNRHLVHFKSGIEEVIVQYDDIALSVPAGIRGQIHYPQNGEAATSTDPAEGQTTCPGPNGCSGLDVDRLVLSQQSGAAPNTNGLITRIFSPGTIFVRDDGSTYTGANHHTHRVSICGGSACGASVAAADYVIVHKVTASMADTTLTAAALNPNVNWTGVQTADKVALFARGGQTYGGLSFTTTHSGTAQYLIAGLAPGTYNVTVNGSPVMAGTRVNSGDNTLYFESTAGAVSIGAAGSVPQAGGVMISGSVAISGNVAH